MKKLLIYTLLLLAIPSVTFPNNGSDKVATKVLELNSSIEDGWYSATVIYFNYNTGTRSRYTLDVYVEYDRVTIIDFGNGGSIHSGYNSYGYIYSGGYLSFERDYNFNIVAATSTVTLTKANGNTITYSVRIS